MPINESVIQSGKWVTSPITADGKDSIKTLNILAFRLQNTSYDEVKMSVKGLKNYSMTIDGKKAEDKIKLTPDSHDIIIRYIAKGQSSDSVEVNITGAGENTNIVNSDKKIYGLTEVWQGKNISTVDLSYDGRYMITTYYETQDNGSNVWTWKLTDRKTNNVIYEAQKNIGFVPLHNMYYFKRQAAKGFDVVATDIATGKETVLARGLDADAYDISPNMDYLILTKVNKGPKEDANAYEIIDPDDRMPNWRDRSSLLFYDVKTGITRPLTFGYANASLLDISYDGKYILFSTNKRHLEKRPTSVSSIYRLNVQTMELKKIISDDGFIESAKFSPDAEEIAVNGSPECLGGVGNILPKGMTPNMYDYHLYTLNITTGKINPLQKDFNPSIERYQWNPYNGMIYFTALDKDSVNMFRQNPKTGKIEKLPAGEEDVTNFAIADKTDALVWVGQSLSNPSRLHCLKGKNVITLEDPRHEDMANVTLGKTGSWKFTGSHGDTITSFYILPPDFDASKKYPMLVYYYGGCSPTSRNFSTRWPWQAFAAQGYVMLLINPSGAAGFGQEFASRHVDTAGHGVAEDIILGTKDFAAKHSFINDKKIGCFGASYGGFMTQYLVTQTDIFATAISHAGISDHTGYWGFGYWGYSYSEVSMANCYPWSDRKLYVDQSPLFNADKIHTPLLLLHGNADTNVPYSQSVQMFNALKLLGRDVAFVTFDGENHHIDNHAKLLKWQKTMFAWFAKYLKDEPKWWNDMYPNGKSFK
jgi:dipeptidyl aminopeptidase/acylaminoacyl peptidase